MRGVVRTPIGSCSVKPYSYFTLLNNTEDNSYKLGDLIKLIDFEWREEYRIIESKINRKSKGKSWLSPSVKSIVRP